MFKTKVFRLKNFNFKDYNWTSILTNNRITEHLVITCVSCQVRNVNSAILSSLISVSTIMSLKCLAVLLSVCKHIFVLTGE